MTDPSTTTHPSPGSDEAVRLGRREGAERLLGITAQLRRLYLHLLHGGQITPDDLSLMIARLEEYHHGRL